MNPETGFLSANGKQLYYEFHNSVMHTSKDAVIVFLHEGLGSCAQWGSFPEQFAAKEKLPVLVYDRYGYGKSESRPVERPNNYMEDEAFVYLPAVLKHFNISKKLILFGHSDGGTISLLFASKFSAILEKVITVADHVFCEPITFDGIKKAKNDYETSFLKKALYKYHKENTESVFYGWANVWLSDYAHQWHLKDFLKNISCPVQIIQGDMDQFGSYAQIEEKLKYIQGKTEVVYLENCGHSPHLQYPEKVTELALNFIKS